MIYAIFPRNTGAILLQHYYAYDSAAKALEDFAFINRDIVVDEYIAVPMTEEQLTAFNQWRRDGSVEADTPNWLRESIRRAS